MTRGNRITRASFIVLMAATIGACARASAPAAVAVTLPEIPAAPDGNDIYAGHEFGPVNSGVQLRIASGWAATERAAQLGLYLIAVQIRNTTDSAVPFDHTRINNMIEYEIDGTWYAHRRLDPVREASELLQPDYIRDLIRNIKTENWVIRPNAVGLTSLVLNLRGRSPQLALYAIAPTGQGRRLTLAAGRHIVRVRPGPSAFGPREASGAVSNAITVDLPPFRVADATALAARSASLRTSLERALRFVNPPGDSRVVAADVLRQPLSYRLMGTPTMADFDDLQFLGPLERHSLALPRRRDSPDPSLPSAPATRFEYPVIAAGVGTWSVLVEMSARGQAHHVSESQEQVVAPLVAALTRVATMEQVRSGNYEPRLLELTGYRGTAPLTVLWLRSRSGQPDLLYYPGNNQAPASADTARRAMVSLFLPKSLLEPNRLYSVDEFFRVAREPVVTPAHDERWAIERATACARATQPQRAPLQIERAVVEVGLNPANDAIVWYVYFPVATDPPKQPDPIVYNWFGQNLFAVDETTSECRVIGHERN